MAKVVPFPLYKVSHGLCQKNYFDFPPSSTVARSVEGSFSLYSGTTPDFAGKKRRRERLPIQPYTCVIDVLVTPQGSFDFYPNGHPEQYHKVSGVLTQEQYVDWTPHAKVPNAILTTDFHTYHRDKLVNQLLNKVKDMSVNIAQTFAERQQTADLIGNTARRIAGAFDAIKRKQWDKVFPRLGVSTTPQYGARVTRRVKANNAVDFAGNALLEYRYGWTPLVSDCYNSLELLAKSYKRRRRVSVQDRVRDLGKASNSVGLGDGLLLNHTDAVNSTGKLSARFSIEYGAPSALSAFGLTNPALLAWETLPYSFVVDQVIAMGDYLSAWDATLGTAFESGAESSKAIMARGTYASNGNGSWQYVGYGTSLHRVTVMRRVNMGGWPYPVFPELKNPVNLYNMLTGIALLKQVFGRK